jgi:hypothetical protein
MKGMRVSSTGGGDEHALPRSLALQGSRELLESGATDRFLPPLCLEVDHVQTEAIAGKNQFFWRCLRCDGGFARLLLYLGASRFEAAELSRREIAECARLGDASEAIVPSQSARSGTSSSFDFS